MIRSLELEEALCLNCGVKFCYIEGTSDGYLCRCCEDVELRAVLDEPPVDWEDILYPKRR